MNRQELEDALYSKGFVFVNKLVEAIGGSKKGGKVQDILEILSIYDTDATMVVDAYYREEWATVVRLGLTFTTNYIPIVISTINNLEDK